MGRHGFSIQDATVDELYSAGEWYLMAGASDSEGLGEVLAETREEGLLSAALRGGRVHATTAFQNSMVINDQAFALTLALSARARGRTIGMLLCGPNLAALPNSPTSDEHRQAMMSSIAKLHMVAVDSEFRNQRIASSLVRRAIEVMRDSGFEVMYGEYESGAMLSKFYERNGFTVLVPGEEALNFSDFVGQPLFVKTDRGEIQFALDL
ncbi:GNAT family N-acetyltransferase [Mycobacteroides salmoniphilum]|uniref:GNAT family N-acetyltransferase n=1 Tax=Mycobacteroides salmoniphilum TaxID=404941 RepID=UPI000992CD8C|nr:GNAT family N-acetyltransferase [Mycobacteroides salmoniphilum]